MKSTCFKLIFSSYEGKKCLRNSSGLNHEGFHIFMVTNHDRCIFNLRIFCVILLLSYSQFCKGLFDVAVSFYLRLLFGTLSNNIDVVFLSLKYVFDCGNTLVSKRHSYSLCFRVLYREDSPLTEVEPYIPFNINPAGMQPVLTTSYLLAFPSIVARY